MEHNFGSAGQRQFRSDRPGRAKLNPTQQRLRMHPADALEQLPTVSRRHSNVACFLCSRDVIAQTDFGWPFQAGQRETTREIDEESFRRGHTMARWKGKEGDRKSYGRMRNGWWRVPETRTIYFANDGQLGKLGGAPDTTHPSENLANKRRKQERGEPKGLHKRKQVR